MTNYEQRLILDLRRSQGKVVGKLEKRLDRHGGKLQLLRQNAGALEARIVALEALLDALLAEGDPSRRDER